MSYAAKYVAKEDTGFNSVPYLTVDQKTGEIIDTPGRVWGVYNRAALPMAEPTIAHIPLDGSYWLIRRYCQKLWMHLNTEAMGSFTIFTDNPLDHLARILNTSKQYIAAAD
jgi:hypothetical protein